MDMHHKRIKMILGEDMERTMQTAERYRNYLIKHLPLPVLVTGSEDFPWEEPYVLRVWDQDEYKELKKTNPSYTDTFELINLEKPNRHEDIVAKLKRVSDEKQFKIGLSWLCCTEKNSDSHLLLDDYGRWHTNY
jgi:hypothetical protein